MRIGIISDTHGDWTAIDNACELAGNVDAWIHLGDCLPDAEYIEKTYEVKVYAVAGNCDWPTKDTCYDKVIELAGYKIFMTHGHDYGMRYTQENILEAAKRQRADIAIFGHTHMVEYIQSSPILLNPGSASHPRDEDRSSFMIIELLPRFEPKITVVRMKRVKYNGR